MQAAKKARHRSIPQKGKRYEPGSNVRPSQRFLVGMASVTLAWSVIVIVTVVVSTQIGVWGLLERIFDGLFYLWILIVSLGLWRSPSLEGTPGRRTFSH